MEEGVSFSQGSLAEGLEGEGSFSSNILSNDSETPCARAGGGYKEGPELQHCVGFRFHFSGFEFHIPVCTPSGR